MHTQRWVTLSLVFIAVIAFFVFRQVAGMVWDLFRIPDFLREDWVIAFPDVVALVLALGLFGILKKNQKVTSFGEEVVVELSKVTYPVGKETLVSAVVVVVMVGIASLVLFTFDAILGSLSQRLLSL